MFETMEYLFKANHLVGRSYKHQRRSDMGMWPPNHSGTNPTTETFARWLQAPGSKQKELTFNTWPDARERTGPRPILISKPQAPIHVCAQL